MKHLLELLERTAARWPDRLSYCDEHRVHTWAQTAAITAAIGSGLCRVGVQGRPVALYLDHETPCIHAMLGVMAAGGFYAVLDTAQPAARVRAITDQLRPAVLLTDEGRKKFLKAWQERKRDILTHPYLNEKMSWGLIPYVQALLLARYIRGDLDAYPPFLWK